MVYIEEKKVSGFLKVVTKLKQLVVKQMDKIVATVFQFLFWGMVAGVPL